MKQLTIETINAIGKERLYEHRCLSLIHVFQGDDSDPIDTLQYAPSPSEFVSSYGPKEFHYEVRPIAGKIRIAWHHEKGIFEGDRKTIEDLIKRTPLNDLKRNETGSWQGFATGELIYCDIPTQFATPDVIAGKLMTFYKIYGYLFDWLIANRYTEFRAL